ncbi:MAG: arginine--tRNA ligase, partial [Candidatus Aenigmatarchaeota archaeon]
MEREITLTLREEEVVDILLEETELERDKLISLLEVPSDSELGDLALPCFELSQIMKKAPEEIAEQLAEEIDTDDSLLERAEPKGPYLNFFF